MTTLKLHEIIESNEVETSSILIELLVPYKKSLLTYYSRLFPSEPILMVTSISNACQYSKIVPDGEFTEALINYIGDYNCMDEENENFCEYETICFNSIPLSNL